MGEYNHTIQAFKAFDDNVVLADVLTLSSIRAEVERCFKLANTEPGLLRIEWDNRSSRRFGCCWYVQDSKQITIRLTRKLWTALSSEDRLDTVRHEAAHGIDYRQRGLSDHGPRWRFLARLVGAKPDRCASLNGETTDELVRRGLRVNARCGCAATRAVTRGIAKKLLQRPGCYRCRSCHKPILLFDARV